MSSPALTRGDDPRHAAFEFGLTPSRCSSWSVWSGPPLLAGRFDGPWAYPVAPVPAPVAVAPAHPGVGRVDPVLTIPFRSATTKEWVP